MHGFDPPADLPHQRSGALLVSLTYGHQDIVPRDKLKECPALSRHAAGGRCYLLAMTRDTRMLSVMLSMTTMRDKRRTHVAGRSGSLDSCCSFLSPHTLSS